MAALYSMFVDLSGRRAVVIGGGTIAERKVAGLLGCGADVTVISPALTETLAGWRDTGRIAAQQRRYQSGDLDGAWLVVAACNDAEANAAVFAECERRRIFCNVVDQPDLCSFQKPAQVRRGDLQIAISTGGSCPALAKRLRQQLQEQFDASYEVVVEAFKRLRDDLGALGVGTDRRAALLSEFLDADPVALLRAGDQAGFDRLREALLARAADAVDGADRGPTGAGGQA